MNTKLDPRMADRRPSRLRLLPTLLTFAIAGTAASSAVEVAYQYYKFTPTVNATAAQNQTQMSEFEFFFRGAKVDATPLNIPGNVTGGTTYPAGGAEGVSKLVDGNVATKWFDNAKAEVTFNFGTPTKIDSYRFATANDSLDRTPIRWVLRGSNNNTSFVIIDDRSGGDNAAPNQLFTFRPLLVATPPASSGFPVFGSFGSPVTAVDTTVANQTVYQALPSIVKNSGPASSLTWSVTNSTGLALLPTFPTVAAVDTKVLEPIAPDAVTDYTLTATNATTTAALNHKVRAVPGGTASTRYVRFTASLLRGGANLVQVGEFQFFNGATQLTGITVTNPGGNTNNNAAEAATSIIDGNFRTKWLNHNNGSLVFDLGSVQTFDGYQMTTGGDAADRDPVRWILESSTDGVNWSLIDNVYDYMPPTTRYAKSGTIPVSGIPTLEWTGSTDGNWDTATTNFTPPGSATPTAYADGLATVFGEASAVRDVVLTAPLAPNSVSILNTTGTYTFSGAPIAGRGDLFKRGAGEAILNSPNTFIGAVYVGGGTLTVGNAGALGARDALPRLQIYDGGTLNVATNATTARRLRIEPTGGSISVAEGVTFFKSGVTDFLGTLTKTGLGTLQFANYRGSTSIAASDLVVNEGVVEFAGTGNFNSRPFTGAAGEGLIATVNTGGILRLSVDSAFGGDYLNFQTSLDQLRVIGGTVDFNHNGFNYIHVGTLPSGEGRIVMQGGVITGNAQIEPAGTSPALTPVTFTILPSADSSVISGGPLALNPENSTLILEVADGAALDDLVINRVISGPRPLVKNGAGSLLLGSQNSFSGPFTVNAGTLTLNSSTTGTATTTLAAGTVLQGLGTLGGATTINGTVKLNLEFLEKMTFGSTLTLGATSSLELTGTLTDPVYQIMPHAGALTGTFGTVTGVPTGYTLVYGTNAITLVSDTAPAYEQFAAGLFDPSFDGDDDKDGIENILEFILNSNPSVSSPGVLPTVSVAPSGDFVFTFVQKASSTYLNPVIEYTATLGDDWQTFEGAVTVTDSPSAGLNTVTATLPAALGSGGKLFARLKVTNP